VGKEDRQPAGAAGGTRMLRFVRKAGQDRVYRVEIDTSKFTTRFDDWIEKDLLKLSPWDVKDVMLDDYALAAVQSEGRLMVEQQRKSRIKLAYNDQDAAWSLTSLEAFDAENPSADPALVTLADGEELDSAKLNDLRNALGDLKIIDVARKPAGLTADLEAEASFLDDDEAVASMQQRGFLPLASGQILSTDGETVVGMKDGVEYVLRFGAGTTVRKSGEEASEEEQATEIPGRYLLVMARFNESLLTKPTLDPLPDAGATEPEATEPEATEPEATEPEATEPEATEPEATEPEPSASVRSASPFRLVAQEQGDTSAAEQTTEDAPPSPPPTAGEVLKAADEAEAKAQAAREERRRVERENRRRQEEYDEKVDAAKKRVRELNGRFAAWFYIVSDEEYGKIHLSQDDVVRAADEGADEGAAGGLGGLPNSPGFSLPPTGP
jgi:hypothetical protein